MEKFTVDTVFGMVELTEVQSSDFWEELFETKQEGPEWLAVFIDGDFKHVRAESWAQSKALKEVIAKAATKYAASLQDEIDGI